MKFAISYSSASLGVDSAHLVAYARHAEATQLEPARSEAAAAGRDPGALEYTRWASISITPERAEALAAEGVTRVVVNVSSTDHAEQRDEMSALAERFDLTGNDGPAGLSAPAWR